MSASPEIAAPGHSARADDAQRAAYDELCAYALAHARTDPAFIHQHVVDAWAAQTAAPEDKPVRLAFALVGLYLRVERRRTGREAQKVHMRLAARPRQWPRLAMPEERGAMTAADVLAVAPGAARDRAIDAWCASVWAGYRHLLPEVLELLEAA